MPKLQSLNYSLTGIISTLHGHSLPGLTVRAYDKDPVSSDDPLGTAVTDERGLYTIRFSAEDFQVKGVERSGPDVFIRVFSGDKLIGESKVRKNVGTKATINVKVDAGRAKPDPKVGEELNTRLAKRLGILDMAIGDAKIKEAISHAFKAAQGDWKLTMEALKKTGVNETLLDKLDFTHVLAEVTGDQQNLVTVLSDLPNISNLRDLALKHNTQSLADILVKKLSADDGLADSRKANATLSAYGIMQNLFPRETSAVLQKMAEAGELSIAEKGLSKAVAGFFANQPAFNIRTTSIYQALKQPDAFKGVAEAKKEIVTGHLKTLQRVQAISPGPEGVAALMQAKFISAHQVADMPEQDFVRTMSAKIGRADAAKIHARATDLKVRNELALMNLAEAVKGAGIAAIDGKEDMKTRKDRLRKMTAKKEIPLHWESLFGGADLCECARCNSVYSPSAYFVELLQYLRNNNLDRSETGDQGIRTSPGDITNTVLAKFFQRRPDLSFLELTCKKREYDIALYRPGKRGDGEFCGPPGNKASPP